MLVYGELQETTILRFSHHCLIKITSDLFFNWEPKLPLSEKCQHWNLSNYVYKDEKTERINVRNIDDILSLWNNTILSFSWHMHPDSFSINVLFKILT